MQYNLKIKGLLLALLFVSNLFSNNFSQSIQKLSNDKYWHTLLHFKNGESQIDSNTFFLHINGKNNPLLELNATISNLEHPLFKDDNSTYCKFPARRVWIEKNFNTLNIKKQTCTKLDDELKSINNINTISLIFPTTHINSPASMFGHTLLRLDNKNKDYLSSYAINYAAFTNEKNGFVYAWQGLTGGYKGKYSIIPYYKKINEYSNMENRDIWEYELNLNKNEIKNLIYHLFEVKHHWSKYYYFNKNCSYEILWLLQSARNNLNLIEKFNYKTVPIDTIKEIYKSNLISASNFRASKQKILLKYYSLINDKELAMEFYNTIDKSLLKNITTSEKKYILNFSMEMLRYDKTKSNITQDKYLRKLLKILSLRSLLGKDNELFISKPKNPVFVHGTNKVAITYHKKNINLEFKPNFHSPDDLDFGFIQGAYIDFFKLNLNINQNKELSLEDISIFNIKSYAKRNTIFKPISWNVDLGNEIFLNNKHYSKIKTSFGVSYGNNNFLNSILIMNNLRYKNNFYYSYGINYFAQYSLNNSHSKFVVDSKIEKINSKLYKLYDLFYVQNINKNLNFKIGYKKKLYSNYAYLGLSYYFD